ncbi:protein ROOT PRIMORDIUM DEFECTIVE 1 [Quercus robur]|uniref:protein ROOT PRIMORDIUM DEFECTIVE 1 n=1 Tax=Quercus robur TaxID=38942 RepID=UPI002162386C|nr:protein ROOT PRIMORDIUM DEFECTIVE 1 [Quercus robur]
MPLLWADFGGDRKFIFKLPWPTKLLLEQIYILQFGLIFAFSQKLCRGSYSATVVLPKRHQVRIRIQQNNSSIKKPRSHLHFNTKTGSLSESNIMRALYRVRPIIIRSTPSSFPFTDPQKCPFGPFNSFTQKRFKKPVISARTRLEDRVRDPKLDELITHLKKLKTILNLHQLMSNKKRGPFVSLQLMSRWKNIVGLNVNIGTFINKYPHVFEVFKHPIRRNLCCRVRQKMKALIEEEERVVKECELEAVQRVKKLLMMSVNGTLGVHALRLIRRELGLPEDFRDSVLAKYNADFRLVGLEIVELVDKDESVGVAKVEFWREKEYREKWLSEFETKYAFPINFPTGFKKEAGFRDKLKNWQRLPYLKPYDRKEVVKVRTCGGIEQFEKRAVGILHEFLSLMVENKVEVERLAHFKRDFAIEVNVRELLLENPGIFYISTKGNAQTVFLREVYSKGHLIEPNPIYVIRRKLLDLVLQGCRSTRELAAEKEIKELSSSAGCTADGGRRDGDWVIPILENFDNENPDNSVSEISE